MVMTRQVKYTLRLSEKEKEDLDKQAGENRMKLSEYFRWKLFGEKWR